MTLFQGEAEDILVLLNHSPVVVDTEVATTRKVSAITDLRRNGAHERAGQRGSASGLAPTTRSPCGSRTVSPIDDARTEGYGMSDRERIRLTQLSSKSG